MRKKFRPSPNDLTLPGLEVVHEAIESSRRGAVPSWMDAARVVIGELAEKKEPFTSDDVWKRLGTNTPKEPRALGPVMKDAERAGTIVKTGDAPHSERRKINHGRKLTGWVGAERLLVAA